MAEQNETAAGTIEDSRCRFSIAWVGRCTQPAVNGGVMCAKHQAAACASCGKPATHDCEETAQFVCGAPLCPDCEHETAEDGTNGGNYYRHCRKDAQKYQPWYARAASTPQR